MVKLCPYFLSALFISFLSYSCAVTQKRPAELPTPSTPCTHTAVLEMDADDNSECSVYFKLNNGMRLIPVEIMADHHTEITIGQTYYIDYEPVSDVQSGCSNEYVVVRLRCLKSLPVRKTILEFSDKAACTKTIDPYQEAWIKKCISHYQPEIITRYAFKKKKNTWAYAFTTAADWYIYDCNAQFLCHSSRTDRSACREILKQLRDSTVILVINEK